MLTAAYAHRDTWLKLQDGKIVGLPEEFSPASFDPKKGHLRIGEREVYFTPEVKAFFADEAVKQVSLKASWYHREEIKPGVRMPPYIVIRLDKTTEGEGYMMTFDMETLEVLSIVEMVRINDKQWKHIGLGDGEAINRRMNAAVRKVKEK